MSDVRSLSGFGFGAAHANFFDFIRVRSFGEWMADRGVECTASQKITACLSAASSLARLTAGWAARLAFLFFQIVPRNFPHVGFFRIRGRHECFAMSQFGIGRISLGSRRRFFCFGFHGRKRGCGSGDVVARLPSLLLVLPVPKRFQALGFFIPPRFARERAGLSRTHRARGLLGFEFLIRIKT